MSSLNPILILAAACTVVMAQQAPAARSIELLTHEYSAQPQTVFAGGAAKISTVWRNNETNGAAVRISTRLYQASSATAAPISEQSWKRLQILPGQTVIESATLEFPAVNAETRFIIQWLEQTNRLLGTTEVLAYPPDLLRQIKNLAGDEPVGAFDPQNQIKLLLNTAQIEATDLADMGFADFRGRLAIIGPFQSKSQVPDQLGSQVRALAHRGVALVWIEPPPEPRAKIKPSFYAVPIGKGTVLVAQANLFADLENSPAAQINLIHMAELALHPDAPALPHLALSP